MSRNTQRIERALAAIGYRATSVEWTPLGANIEMQGPEGGWVVQAEPVDDDDPRPAEYFPGMNVEQVLEGIGLCARPDYRGRY